MSDDTLNRAARAARRLAVAVDRVGVDAQTQAITGHPAFPPVQRLAHRLADLLHPDQVASHDDIVRARSVARDLRSPAHSLARHVRGLSLDRDPHYRDGTQARPRDVSHSLVPHIPPAHDRAQRLLAALGGVGGMQRDLAHALAAVRRDMPDDRVAPSARCLVTAASWLLPAADRERHSSEFHKGLAGIATSGGGRWQQLRYAARLFLPAWSSRRRSLRAPI